MTSFLGTNPPKVVLKVHLDYLNTHSTECVLVLFKKLDDYFHASGKDISIYWIFDEDDEDMQGLGDDLGSFVSLPFVVEEVEE